MQADAAGSTPQKKKMEGRMNKVETEENLHHQSTSSSGQSGPPLQLKSEAAAGPGKITQNIEPADSPPLPWLVQRLQQMKRTSSHASSGNRNPGIQPSDPLPEASDP